MLPVGGVCVGVLSQAPSNKTHIKARRIVEYAVRLTRRERDDLIEGKIPLDIAGYQISVQPL